MPKGEVKRRSTNRQGWWRLGRASWRIVRYEDAVLVLLEAHTVSEPLFVRCGGERVKILDHGYMWLFVLREGAKHVVTAHCDASDTPVHWYIDVVDGWQVGEDGFPEYDDLFLDVVATPAGTVELRDAPELEEALANGSVSYDQYQSAWSEAGQVTLALRAGRLQAVERTREYLVAMGQPGTA